MRDGLAMHDSLGRLIGWNPAAATITGWTKAEAAARFRPDLPDGLVDLGMARWVEVRHVDTSAAGRAVRVTLFTDARPHVALRDAYASLEAVETTDPLTGLANRALAEDRLRLSATIARRDDRPIGLIHLDIDRFNLINDTLGHAAGDAVLRDVAARLRASIGESDTAARVGADEFIVILHTIGHSDEAGGVAAGILAALERPFEVGGQEIFLSASLGLAVYPDHGFDAAGLLQAADLAMQDAKRDGGRTFRRYASALGENSRDRIALAADLHRALAKTEFEVHYQPQVDIDSGMIVGSEALIRWRHPDRGLLCPAQFLAVAEEDGFVVDIDAWVLGAACRQLQAWDAQGFEMPMVSVNFSARTFATADVASLVTDALAASGLEPSRLEIEVTEQVVADQAGAERKVAELKQLGVQIAIDDFGTGYSSLGHLKRFAFDTIKLDRSFVVDVTGQPRASDIAVLRAIVTMAGDLGLRCVAEGVETVAQRKVLRFLRCHLVQGFLYGRPVPPHELAAGAIRQVPVEVVEPAG